MSSEHASQDNEKGFSDEKDSQPEIRTEDIALAVIAKNAESAAITEAEERSVLWKVSIPLFFYITTSAIISSYFVSIFSY